MKKILSRTAALALVFLFLFLCAPAAMASDGYQGNYTYTYDYWGIVRESPDAYRVSSVVNSLTLGLTTRMRSPGGMFVRGEDIYICDTGNNRILQIHRDGASFSLTRVIDTIAGDVTPNTFSKPQDIYVNDKGEMFICDTENNRVVKLDRDLNHLLSFTKPDDSTFDQSLSFLPTRVVSDTTGRAFVLGLNVNKGVIKYESDGAFTGFVGASEAKYSWYEYVWKRLSSKEQRSKQASFVPTEYDNLYMDSEGFIFAVTTVFSEYDLMSDVAKPIRRINALGEDILVKNGVYLPIGDIDWTDEGSVTGPSKLVDITVLENDIYVAVDRVRGRLFGYDPQGNLLWAFGGSGNVDGCFLNPVAVEHMGYDLLVLDARECSLTVFTPTEYGQLIFDASEEYLTGEYDLSAAHWQKVLNLNANYELAYVGIGRALLRQEKYEEAMAHFKHVRVADKYGDAFRLYRKAWVEENAGYLFLGLFALLLGPLAYGAVKKIKAEVNGA